MTDQQTPTVPLVARSLAVTEGRPLSQNPAAVYLASLSEGSRPTMKHSLNTIARKLTGGRVDCFTLDWGKLRYQHTVAVRSWLMDRYQPATVNKMLSALRRALYFAWKLGQIGESDYRHARDVASLRYETIPAGRAISTDELALLLLVCKQDDSPTGQRDAAIIATMYQTGIRRSSVPKITMGDYTPDNGEMVVHAKGHKTLTVYLTGGAQHAVADWIALRGDEPGPLFCRVYKGGKIKPSSGLSAQAVYDILRRRSGQTGINPVTPHDLRRSFVTGLLEMGVDLATVQHMAGHASPSTTERYDRRGEEIRRKAAAKLTIPYTGKLE